MTEIGREAAIGASGRIYQRLMTGTAYTQPSQSRASTFNANSTGLCSKYEQQHIALQD